MRCNKDCFNCPYPDCILDMSEVKAVMLKQQRKAEYQKEYFKKYRVDHSEELKKFQKKYSQINKEALDIKRRMRRIKAKMDFMSVCCWCKKENDKPHEMIKYKKSYFCCEECLGEYLVDKANAKNELDIVFVDTEANIEMLAKEEKAAWDRDARTR